MHEGTNPLTLWFQQAKEKESLLEKHVPHGLKPLLKVPLPSSARLRINPLTHGTLELLI